MIYSRYINSVKIDKEEFIKKIEKISKEKFSEEYNLSEIVFTKKNDITIEELFENIQQSINENGFENTANIYSASDTSRVGGKIGWVKKNLLSEKISEKLKFLKKGEYTEPFKINNNFFIFKINDIRKIQMELDKKKELEKMVLIETSKQLDKFSNIFYNKIKLNSKISEF